jgi:multidrug efflux system outer membrane protein
MRVEAAVTRVAAAVVTVVVTAGCTQGPNYGRPVVTPPDTFRGAAETVAAPSASVGDLQWSALFEDEALRSLIAEALENNYDLRIAAARILQAEAQYGVTRSQRFPTVNAQGTVQGQHGSVINGESLPTVGLGQFTLNGSWEPDFWGKFKRANEAARADILASEWGRRAILTSLIGQVATGYFNLRALDSELEIARRTVTTREESLRLTEVRERGGATSLVDVRQAEGLVLTARGQIIDIERLIEQQENAISVLLGRNPGPIPRGRPLVEQPHAPDVPAGLPSALLDRRPDVQVAEQLLIASNAEIGIARANYFPQVTLTGAGGIASTALSNLFTAGMWSVAATAVQPIFNAGRTRSQVELAEARRLESELVYRQTIQQAFREVSDALVAYRRLREFRETQQAVVVAAQDARRLADLRYQGGATSYLEVLDSDTRLFSAELSLVEAQFRELAAFVEIYRSLGGGWQQ